MTARPFDQFRIAPSVSVSGRRLLRFVRAWKTRAGRRDYVFDMVLAEQDGAVHMLYVYGPTDSCGIVTTDRVIREGRATADVEIRRCIGILVADPTCAVEFDRNVEAETLAKVWSGFAAAAGAATLSLIE